MASLDIQAIQDAKDAINEEKIPHTEFMRVAMHGSVFLVPVEVVLSVVRPSVITPIPMAPDHLIGAANVRGQIFCIINVGKILKLDNGAQEKTTKTRFLLLRHERVHLGVWVDEVAELYSVPTADVPEDSGEKFVKGSLHVGNEDISILRVSLLFD